MKTAFLNALASSPKQSKKINIPDLELNILEPEKEHSEILIENIVNKNLLRVFVPSLLSDVRSALADHYKPIDDCFELQNSPENRLILKSLCNATFPDEIIEQEPISEAEKPELSLLPTRSLAGSSLTQSEKVKFICDTVNLTVSEFMDECINHYFNLLHKN